MPRGLGSAGIVAAWVALLVVAAVLRLSGAGQFLPFLIEPDCDIPVQVRLKESQVENPGAVYGWERYPHVLSQLTVATTDPMPEIALDAPLERHIAAAGDDILRVRRVGAWVSVLMVLGTLLLARKILPPGWTLLAGAFAATSLLAVHFAVQARPHAAASGFVALAVAAAASLPTRPTLGRYVLMSVLAGLALGTLQSALALGPPLLVAHLLAQRGKPAQKHLLLFVPLVVVALSVVLFYPWLLAPAVETPAARIEDGLLIQGGHKVMLDLFNGGGFAVIGGALATWEPALAIGFALSVVVGLFSFVRRRTLPAWKPATIVMLAYAVPYGLVLGLYARSYERFLVPLLPFIAVFAAWGLMRLAREGPRARVAAFAIAAILVTTSTTIAGKLSYLRTQPSTIELAQDWLMARVDETSPRVWTMRPHTLPTLQKPAGEWEDERDHPIASERGLGWGSYRRSVLADHPGPRIGMAHLPVGRRKSLIVDELRKNPDGYFARLTPGEFVLAEVFTRGRYFPMLSVLTRELRSRYPVEARFDTGDGSEHPLGYQDPTGIENTPMAWRVLRSSRVGPVLEIYRTSPPSVTDSAVR